MFWRKNWHWLLTLIVVFGIGGFILFKLKTPVTVKKVYKVPDLSQVRKDMSNKGNETPAEQTVSENTETPVGKSPDPADDTSETLLASPEENVPLEDVEDVATPAAEIDDWRTNDYGESSYGYGAYPNIPSDFPDMYRPAWTLNVLIQSDRTKERLRIRELLSRVRIKLWNQGRTDVTGIFLHPSTNKVYPCTPNTVYVRYKATATTKRISSVFCGPNISNSLVNRIKNGEKPAGIQILDQDSNGFNLYQFLGL